MLRTNSTRKLLWLSPDRATEGALGGAAGTPLQFEYDGILESSDGQDRVYKEIARPLIDEVTIGRAACLMCYGQTGTGKTYTFGGGEALRAGGAALQGCGGARGASAGGMGGATRA